jgi:hypothetical protein
VLKVLLVASWERRHVEENMDVKPQVEVREPIAVKE